MFPPGFLIYHLQILNSVGICILASVVEIYAEQRFFLHEQKGHGMFSISCSKYYEGIKIKKDDVGGACSTCGRDAKYIQNYGQEI